MTASRILRMVIYAFPQGLGAWVALLLLLPSLRAEEQSSMTYRGEARDASGALVYTETHQVSFSSGSRRESVTEYRGPDGVLLATLKSDYSRSLTLPTYVFEDFRRNYREGLRWQDGRYVIFNQKATAQEKTAVLQPGEALFSCQGWHYHLLDNLGLLEREGVILNLVLPSKLRPIPVEVRPLATDKSQVSAELHLRHWLLRHFAPTLRLSYDKENRRLTEFHGVSNILDPAGRPQVLTIRYRFPEG